MGSYCLTENPGAQEAVGVTGADVGEVVGADHAGLVGQNGKLRFYSKHNGKQ